MIMALCSSTFLSTLLLRFLFAGGLCKESRPFEFYSLCGFQKPTWAVCGYCHWLWYNGVPDWKSSGRSRDDDIKKLQEWQQSTTVRAAHVSGLNPTDQTQLKLSTTCGFSTTYGDIYYYEFDLFIFFYLFIFIFVAVLYGQCCRNNFFFLHFCCIQISMALQYYGLTTTVVRVWQKHKKINRIKMSKVDWIIIMNNFSIHTPPWKIYVLDSYDNDIMVYGFIFTVFFWWF